MRKAKKKLKKIFVPHAHNEYHPHIFRNTTLVAVFCISAFLLGLSYSNNFFLKGTVLGANIATDVLVDLANTQRAENHIGKLKRNKKLDSAAGYKVNDMISKQYFSHDSPDGVTPWFFIDKAGYNFTYAGENLAINFSNEQKLNDAWFASPTHRANLLNSKFKDIGMASKEGSYQGGESVYVVQMFGAEDTTPIQPERAKVPRDIEVQTVAVSDNLIIAKKVVSTTTVEVAVNDKVEAEVAGAETYSSWWERLIFNQAYYVQIFYFILLVVFGLAFAIRIFIEYKRQHTRHLVITSIFLALLLVLAWVNYGFILVI